MMLESKMDGYFVIFHRSKLVNQPIVDHPTHA